MTKFTITIPRSDIRNPYAQVALRRRAGAMKHRSAPRGGGRNSQRDFLEEYADDLEELRA